MAIKFTGNVSYKAKKPFVEREEYATVAEMKNAAEAGLNEGLVAFVKETSKKYEYKSTNSEDGTTGKWREVAFLTKEEKALVEGLEDRLNDISTNAEKTVEVESTGLIHKIKFGGNVVGTINIPQDVFAQNFEYIQAEKKLKITLSNQQSVEVDVADLVNTYTAGTGLQVQGGEFSLTAEYTALPSKVSTLEQKVQTLEGKPSYELGFVKEGNKLPVVQEGNKLYVEVTPQELPEKVTNDKDGLMAKEDFKKLKAISNHVYIVNEEDFNEKEAAGKLKENAIYFIDAGITKGSTPEAFEA